MSAIDNYVVMPYEITGSFLTGDSNLSTDSISEIQRKINLPIGKMDFPLFRYIMSYKSHLKQINYILTKIKEYDIITLGKFNNNEFRKKNTDMDCCFTIIFYYESLFNKIYSTLENIAKINLLFFKVRAPHNFHDQCKRIRNGSLSFSDKCDSTIKEMESWYEDFLSLRSDMTHYTTGLCVYEKMEDGSYITQYYCNRITPRGNKQDSDSTSINIIESTNHYYYNFINGINNIFLSYLYNMDGNITTKFTIISNDYVELRKISINQYLNYEKGKSLGKWPIVK